MEEDAIKENKKNNIFKKWNWGIILLLILLLLLISNTFQLENIINKLSNIENTNKELINMKNNSIQNNIVENNTIENNVTENSTVENNTIENNIVENNTVENNTVENKATKNNINKKEYGGGFINSNLKWEEFDDGYSDLNDTIISNYTDFKKFINVNFLNDYEIDKKRNYLFDKYNEDYFSKKSLAYIYIPTGCSDDKFQSLDLYTKGNTLYYCADVKYHTGFGCCDVHGFSLVIEIDKNINKIANVYDEVENDYFFQKYKKSCD